jgi:hypothetical protein
VPPNAAPPPPGPPDPLTPDERLWVTEYLVDHNKTRATMRLYPGLGYVAADSYGQGVFNRPRVRAEINAYVRAQFARGSVRADRVFRGLVWCATYDVADVEDRETGGLLPPHKIPRETREAMTGIKVRRLRDRRRYVGAGESRCEVTTTEEIIEYKFVDKLRAKEKVCERLGLLTPVTPLESLFALIPPDLAAQVRACLTAPDAAAGR